MEFRPYYMAREWMRLGHQVRIVAATHSHLRQENPAGDAPCRFELVDRIEYVWLRTPAYEGNGIGRVRNMLAFVYGLYRHQNEFLRDFAPDVVIASSTYPLDIFPARAIARRFGARLVFEVHDLWPLSPMELGNMSRFHPFIMTMQVGEDFACKHADHVVSMLPKAAEHLQSRGMQPEKFVYVPNGAVLEDWSLDGKRLPDAHRDALAGYAARKRFVVMYAGAHGLLNNLDIVLDAARELADTPIQFCLVGHGPEKARLEQRARELGVTNVDFLPSVPKDSVPQLLEHADALFLSFAPQPLFRFGVSPNKLMDYMMAGKPVIAAMRAGNDPPTELGFGWSVAPDDPHALAAALRTLAAMPAADRAVLAGRARTAAEQQYAYPALARRFAGLFSKTP
jgi:glycosyltransferase involved in cell wall biosynthesis